ncbi:MAG TPA: hypothetical protein VHL58_16650 [Thermoanaerobaculia bacterium]|nr:hypothetical protein [Thermoanaerobaculia bacterium]
MPDNPVEAVLPAESEPQPEKKKMKAKTMKAPVKAKTPRAPRMAVSESTIKKAAARLVPQGALVSTEIHYIQRVLGISATQSEIDEKVIAVRKMPWESIVIAE